MTPYLEKELKKACKEESKHRYWWESTVSSITYWLLIALAIGLVVWIGSIIASILIHIFR